MKSTTGAQGKLRARDQLVPLASGCQACSSAAGDREPSAGLCLLHLTTPSQSVGQDLALGVEGGRLELERSYMPGTSWELRHKFNNTGSRGGRGHLRLMGAECRTSQ